MLEGVSRGVYRLSDGSPLGNPDLVTVATRVPTGVICLDTVVEAVRFYRERKPVQVDELMRYAAICRVKKIIRPYLEALL